MRRNRFLNLFSSFLKNPQDFKFFPPLVLGEWEISSLFLFQFVTTVNGCQVIKEEGRSSSK